MPELPEVETMRRGVLPVVGSTIRAVDFVKSRFKKILTWPTPAKFRRRTIDQEIVDIGRVGKRVLLELANEHAVVIEPRMTGLVLLADPPDEEHLRVGFQLEDGPVETLWFWDRRGLGTVRVLSPDERSEMLGPKKLGPDALLITAEEMQERLGKSRRAIKVALLDQKAIAGVGNLYASELLHVAEIHPEKRCDRISKSQWSAIQQAMHDVLQEAIQHEGSTLSDGTYRNALNVEGGYQNCHRVYGRKDEKCPRCRTSTVQRIVQAQRSTFFCPRCQKKRATKQ
jgi:formamidopyrimidine-DNA glycosylase